MSLARAIETRASPLLGALYVLAAGLSWSFTGVAMRLAPHLDPWQFLTYRCIGIACAFAIILHLRKPGAVVGQLFALGWLGAIVTAGFCVAAIGFIVAMKITTVANALFLNSCSPLLGAVLGYVVLGERLNARQIGSVALGFGGIAIIVFGGLQAGSFVGNACAALSALGFAGASVAMRLRPGRDFNSALLGYGICTTLLAGAVCVWNGTATTAPLDEALIAFGAGFVLMGLGFSLFLRGAPSLPAVGQMVLAQTETVFGPVWVWLAFAESPSNATLAGGAVILVAVVAMAFAAGKPPIAPPP